MEIKRRRLLQLLAAAPLSALLPGQALAQERTTLLASAADARDGSHWLMVIDEEGHSWLRHPLPDRAHHVTSHPRRPWVAAVARRPGYYIEIVDYRSGERVQRVTPEPGRHFYGHALFSADGRQLFATEMDIASGQGRVTVRRTDTFAKIADWYSGGIGPHELLLSPDQSRIIVANGGILTDGRDDLNIDRMQPSLAYLDSRSGELLEQHYMAAADHQLSIRHIDVNAEGSVVIALQYQGDPGDDKPLVALHRAGQPLQLLRAPPAINRRMVQYCGSARFDASGKIAAVSAPRGDLITFWDSHSGEFLTQLEAKDGCGIAATADAESFIVTTGRGSCYALYPREEYREPLLLPPPLKALAWDNHLAIFEALG